ncbi:hypothetical protein GGI35DRAFT_449703 [Trichoderma velutinum]
MHFRNTFAISAVLAYVPEVFCAVQANGPECQRDDFSCRWQGCQSNTPYWIGQEVNGWTLTSWTRFENINDLCNSGSDEDPGADCCQSSKFGSRCNGEGSYKLLWCR